MDKVELTGQYYINVIDEIFSYPQNYTGFAIKSSGGTVRLLAYKFNLIPLDIVTILNQMVSDGQLRELGIVGFDMTYGPIKE